jgi:hypothetical protein
MRFLLAVRREQFTSAQAGKVAPLPAGNEADVRKKRRQATFCQ